MVTLSMLLKAVDISALLNTFDAFVASGSGPAGRDRLLAAILEVQRRG